MAEGFLPPSVMVADVEGYRTGMTRAVGATRDWESEVTKAAAAAQSAAKGELAQSDATTVAAKAAIANERAQLAQADASIAAGRSAKVAAESQAASAETAGSKWGALGSAIGKAGAIAGLAIVALGAETIKMSANFNRTLELVRTQAGASTFTGYQSTQAAAGKLSTIGGLAGTTGTALSGIFTQANTSLTTNRASLNQYVTKIRALVPPGAEQGSDRRREPVLDAGKRVSRPRFLPRQQRRVS